MESSPIKMVSVKLKSSSKKVGGISPFCPFDSTGTWSYAVDGQTYEAHGYLPSIFYQHEGDNSHPCGFCSRWRLTPGPHLGPVYWC